VTDRAPLLLVRGVEKRFGSVVALRSADLTVRPGEIHALLGANGAGKSTLVKILAGAISADAGTVHMNGEPVRVRAPSDALSTGVATVFQDPALIPDLTVDENLRLTGVEAGPVRETLDRIGLVGLDLDAPIKEIQLPVLRVLDLARALVHDPHLLVLDEITAALPADLAQRVVEIMRERRDRGRSVLFITHRLSEVLRVCDRATILRDGRHVAELVPGEGGEDRLVEPMLGEVSAAVAEPPAPRAKAAEGGVVLEARTLSSREYLNGVSFELRSGEVLGLVALEGQGQDRLFDVLSGDRPFDGGDLVANGAPLRARSPFDAIRRGVVLIPSDRMLALLPKRSVRENLASALYNRVSRWFSLLSNEEQLVDDVIERLTIDTRAHREARRLSGGNQQKLAVGRWLAAGFRTLLCFDPTRGIDIRTKEQIYTLLRGLADEGSAILYYTSELAEIPLICDRVLVMYGGKIVHEQAAATADEAMLLRAAHGLQEASA